MHTGQPTGSPKLAASSPDVPEARAALRSRPRLRMDGSIRWRPHPTGNHDPMPEAQQRDRRRRGKGGASAGKLLTCPMMQ